MRNLPLFSQLILKKILMVTLLVSVLSIMSTSTMADIAVVVHPSNPLAALTEDDVRRIFMGRMRMFPDSDAAIEAVDQNEASTAFVDFYHAIARVTPAKLKRQRASYLFSGKGRLPTTLRDDAAVIEFVSTNPEAIGYVESDKLDARVKAVMTVAK